MGQTYNTIHLSGNSRLIEQPAHSATIYPGHLLQQYSDGSLELHATAGGPVSPIFAQEDAMQGNTIGTVYAIANPVQARVEQRGSLTLAFLKPGTSYAIGVFLQSNGDGTLETQTSTGVGVAEVVDAIDLSASHSVATLARVRVL